MFWFLRNTGCSTDVLFEQWKKPGCWGYTGDYTTYVGIVINPCKDPYEIISIMECHRFFKWLILLPRMIWFHVIEMLRDLMEVSWRIHPMKGCHSSVSGLLYTLLDGGWILWALFLKDVKWCIWNSDVILLWQKLVATHYKIAAWLTNASRHRPPCQTIRIHARWRNGKRNSSFF